MLREVILTSFIQSK